MKQKALDILKEQCKNTIDEKYPAEGKVMVFGEGSPDADIVLVGEAPGERETKLVRPFVGQAGKNLDEFLEILQLKRENIYITNTVKFRPFKINPKTGRLSNRPPEKDEIELCLPFVEKQLEIINPRVVVTLGNTPLKALTGKGNIAIGEVHGKPLHTDRWCLFPLYHPASIIYNAGLKQTYKEDLQKLKEFLLMGD